MYITIIFLVTQLKKEEEYHMSSTKPNKFVDKISVTRREPRCNLRRQHTLNKNIYYTWHLNKCMLLNSSYTKKYMECWSSVQKMLIPISVLILDIILLLFPVLHTDPTTFQGAFFFYTKAISTFLLWLFDSKLFGLGGAVKGMPHSPIE